MVQQVLTQSALSLHIYFYHDTNRKFADKIALVAPDCMDI